MKEMEREDRIRNRLKKNQMKLEKKDQLGQHSGRRNFGGQATLLSRR